MSFACASDPVIIAPSFLERMLEDARNAAPLECCGVLGGRGAVVTSVYSITNDLQSSTEFEANPKELFGAIRSMRGKNEDMIGIYHSHPFSSPEPSSTDADRNFYPGLYYFIISLDNDEPETQCFRMNEDKTFSSIQIV